MNKRKRNYNQISREEPNAYQDDQSLEKDAQCNILAQSNYKKKLRSSTKEAKSSGDKQSPNENHWPKQNEVALIPSQARATTHSRRPLMYRTCTLKATYVFLIAERKKTYEGRVHSKFFQPFREGMHVTWFAGALASVKTKIERKQLFPSFRDMLITIGYKQFIPSATSLNQAIEMYNQIPGYAEKAAIFGVCAFKLLVIDESNSDSKEVDQKSLKKIL